MNKDSFFPLHFENQNKSKVVCICKPLLSPQVCFAAVEYVSLRFVCTEYVFRYVYVRVPACAWRVANVFCQRWKVKVGGACGSPSSPEGFHSLSVSGKEKQQKTTKKRKL